MSKKYLTPAELAERWGVSLSTVYSRTSNGDDMPVSVRIGKVRRYALDKLESWEDAHECK